MNSSLTFPFQAPAPGHFVEIAPGVRWIRMPMPYRLDHVNVWALHDDEGWALVDTGLNTLESMNQWETLLSQSPLSGQVTRVFVTHMHPDHIGLAGWLTRRYNARLWISALEYLMSLDQASKAGKEAPSSALHFYREAGWTEAAIEKYSAAYRSDEIANYPLPDSFNRLKDGSQLMIGGLKWEVVCGYGHSVEHCCLYCADLNLLLSGDQVLPRISSNISVLPIEPDADPMGEWFASMEILKRRVPADALVAPAHHDVFVGLHARIDQLVRDQHDSLDKLRVMLKTPRRVVDVFGVLFRSRISEADLIQLGMATGEALANLNYLLHRKEITREVRGGIAWYAVR
jgi:glyoxylase-like metal-dependent hydrolase (beta-lactamase superfamily II)